MNARQDRNVSRYCTVYQWFGSSQSQGFFILEYLWTPGETDPTYPLLI